MTTERIESSVTCVSWIPMGALGGTMGMPFELGVAHYDLPPPDQLDDLERLIATDACRFANELRAWIEVDDGRITGWGQRGRGHIGATTLRLGRRAVSFPAVAFPELRPEPEAAADRVRFVQTAGGRTAVAAPRPVRRKPFVQVTAPAAWSTLALTIHADGTDKFELIGASPFPRHWVYDSAGRLAAKTGLIDVHTWLRESFGSHTPWGAEDEPALVMAVESALERQLSRIIIEGGPEFRRLAAGSTLVEQGDPGDELFLLFDGVLIVEIDGEVVTELGPGAILGEMALLQGGRRTATLRARTACRIAVVPGDRIDRDALAEIARGRQKPGPAASADQGV